MEFGRNGITLDKHGDVLMEMLSSAAGLIEPSDEVLKDLLTKANSATFYRRISQPDMDHIPETSRLAYRQQAECLIEETGIPVDSETNHATIPWSMAPKLGKACLHILANPQKFPSLYRRILWWLHHSLGS